MSIEQIIARLLKFDESVEVSENGDNVRVVLSTLTSDAIASVSTIEEVNELVLQGQLLAGIDVLRSLQQMKKLKHLGVQCQNGGCLLPLLSRMPSLTSVTIALRETPSIEVFCFLRKCIRLESIGVWIDAKYEIDNECLTYLEGMSELRRLDFHDCTVTANFHGLRHLRHLEYIDFTHARIRVQSLNSIKHCSELKLLKVSFTECGDESIECFTDCRGIRRLFCEKTKLTESAISIFVQFPNLEDLWIDVSIVTENNFQMLSQCKSLRRLTFFGVNMGRRLERQMRKSLPECEIRLLLTDRKGC
jgi:hypothetical protein